MYLSTDWTSERGEESARADVGGGFKWPRSFTSHNWSSLKNAYDVLAGVEHVIERDRCELFSRSDFSTLERVRSFVRDAAKPSKPSSKFTRLFARLLVARCSPASLNVPAYPLLSPNQRSNDESSNPLCYENTTNFIFLFGSNLESNILLKFNTNIQVKKTTFGQNRF